MFKEFKYIDLYAMDGSMMYYHFHGWSQTFFVFTCVFLIQVFYTFIC